MTSSAVVGLVTGGTAIAIDRRLASMAVVAPTELVVTRTHHFVALKAAVTRVATQVLVAILAVGILVGGLLGVIGPELQAVVFG